MKKILGLMTCFNRRDKTIRSITRLIEGNPKCSFEFIVADDNSNDGTREALNEFPNILVLDGTGSLFYSGGMRLAIDFALKRNNTYDYILLFNDDVFFFNSCIEGLVQRATKCHSIWVGSTCDEEGNISYGGVKKTSQIRPSFSIVKSELEEGLDCDTFNANCVLIPWDIFLKLGNMDECYSHSLGDFDYGFTAKRMGFVIKVSNDFVGVCNDNPRKGCWVDVSLPRKQRLRLKESPKGLPRKEWFHYLQKNYSIISALIWSIIPYLKILFRR